MLCGVILMEIELSIVMENGAWNLSKHETCIFKFYDQVNMDNIIYNLRDFFNISGKLNTLIVFSDRKKIVKL